MVDYGVTTTGFVKKTFQEILDDKEATARSLFGSDIDLTARSPLMKFIEVTTLEEAKIWDMAESLYYSAYLAYATGSNLDDLVELISVTRLPATKATGFVTFYGEEGTVVPLGTRVGTSGTSPIYFDTDVEGTISGGSVTIAVTAADYGWDGNVAVATVTVLYSTVTGVNTITNQASMSGGTDVETDADLRERARFTAAALGRGTPESIASAIRALSGVESVGWSENFSLHEMTVFVYGRQPTDTEVDDVIDAYRPAGIKVNWYAGTPVYIVVDATVEIDEDVLFEEFSGSYPLIGAQIQNDIYNHINSLEMGDDVIKTKVYEIIHDVGASVYEVEILNLGIKAVAWYDPNVTITDAQIARIENRNDIVINTE